jgi:hypothetical protein
MVATFWDMAASFVNNGAIDEKMFNDANGEHLLVLAKVEPFLAEYREKVGQPAYLQHLETLVMRMPHARERLKATRERIRALVAARQAATQAAKG